MWYTIFVNILTRRYIMDFSKLIAERYSVRKFENKHLTQSEIDEILAAGHIAPTGCNIQPQRILVLNTDQSIKKLKPCTKCHFDAPCAFLVCFDKTECWQRKYDGALSGYADASIVATHMMLKICDMGLGSTWVMHFDPAKMRETYNIPENIEPVALLVAGYPSRDAAPLQMHFDQRPLDEVTVYDSF